MHKWGIVITCHRTAYAARDKLIEATQRPQRGVATSLEHQEAYNLHKLVRKRFPRRFHSVRNIDDIWEIDLADLKSIKDTTMGFLPSS